MDTNHQHDHGNKNETQEPASKELSSVFEKLPNEIPLLLITNKTKDDPFTDAARQVIQSIRNLTPKIPLKEFDITHKNAKKYNVETTPTLLFDPDNYAIRWLGAPMGEEGRIFIEALVMMGFRLNNLSEASSSVLEKIDSIRNIKVFISPT